MLQNSHFHQDQSHLISISVFTWHSHPRQAQDFDPASVSCVWLVQWNRQWRADHGHLFKHNLVFLFMYKVQWLPWWLSGKESSCNVGNAGSIPGWGRYPGGGNGNQFQYCLENSMDRGTWWATVHWVTRVRNDLVTKQQQQGSIALHHAWVCFLYSLRNVSLEDNQLWIFIGRTDAEALIFWPPDRKTQLIGKDPVAGKDWGQEQNGATEDEMGRQNHWLCGHEFEEILGDSEGQGRLGCCSPCGRKESDMTEWLNSNILN